MSITSEKSATTLAALLSTIAVSLLTISSCQGQQTPDGQVPAEQTTVRPANVQENRPEQPTETAQPKPVEAPAPGVPIDERTYRELKKGQP